MIANDQFQNRSSVKSEHKQNYSFTNINYCIHILKMPTQKQLKTTQKVGGKAPVTSAKAPAKTRGGKAPVTSAKAPAKTQGGKAPTNSAKTPAKTQGGKAPTSSAKAPAKTQGGKAPVTSAKAPAKTRGGKAPTSSAKAHKCKIVRGGTVNLENQGLPVNFITNSRNWETLSNGDEVYVCGKDCYPNNLTSTEPCLPRCLYTKSGNGEPMNIEPFFKYKKVSPKTSDKTVYISYGPPGSGKGSVLEYIHNNLGVSKDTVIEVNVDSIIQGNHEVGDKFREYKDDLKKLENIKNNTNIEVLQGRLYSYFRWIADQISDMILQKAMLENYNILWETTGSSGIEYINKWITDKKTKGYTVKIIYPYVELNTLKQRVKTRAKESGQIAASDKKITTMYKAAVKNLNKLKINKKDIIIIDNNDDPRNFGSKIINTEEFMKKHNKSETPTKKLNKQVGVNPYGRQLSISK
jgi:predicted ABC-type ATPase